MEVGVELLALRVELDHVEALEAGVHHSLSHRHALLYFHETLSQFFYVFLFLYFHLAQVVETHLKVVAYIEEVLRELSYGELACRVDLLLVSLDGIVVLCELIDQLLLVLLDLLLEGLDLLILLPDQLLDLLDIRLRERLATRALVLARGGGLLLIILLFGLFFLLGLLLKPYLLRSMNTYLRFFSSLFLLGIILLLIVVSEPSEALVGHLTRYIKSLGLTPSCKCVQSSCSLQDCHSLLSKQNG